MTYVVRRARHELQNIVLLTSNSVHQAESGVQICCWFHSNHWIDITEKLSYRRIVSWVHNIFELFYFNDYQ